MIAQEDNELFGWLLNAAGYGHTAAGGDFLKNLAEAGLRADSMNYSILRPVLLTMMARYPVYKGGAS